jgi:hypothetical protein
MVKALSNEMSSVSHSHCLSPAASWWWTLPPDAALRVFRDSFHRSPRGVGANQSFTTASIVRLCNMHEA